MLLLYFLIVSVRSVGELEDERVGCKHQEMGGVDRENGFVAQRVEADLSEQEIAPSDVPLTIALQLRIFYGQHLVGGVGALRATGEAHIVGLDDEGVLLGDAEQLADGIGQAVFLLTLREALHIGTLAQRGQHLSAPLSHEVLDDDNHIGQRAVLRVGHNSQLVANANLSKHLMAAFLLQNTIA